ncbi:MAG: HlyD family secretion protein [Moritella sp.]|uniref:HlyD family secretion protein n=1 Tax=Moritella sp. TaxID=78556 RepID=UPI0029AEE300|nr:HlyD family secretion protein [Moritella sp.]MDX2320884.1 HlyD family secretion protein [Moritella sp.]
MPHTQSTFRRWMRSLILLFIIIMAYIIVADRYAPLTTESRVYGYVVQVAPEVSGPITEVAIRNNQAVEKGQLLFSINNSKYILAVNKAKVALQQAYEQETSLYAQVEAAIANTASSKASYINAAAEYQRISKLAKKQLVSVSMQDSAYAKYQAARSTLHAYQQQTLAIKAKLGEVSGDSSLVMAAKNNLAQAELSLSHTHIFAPNKGVITNLQLEVGAMATANQPMLTFISSDSLWVAADFREKATTLISKTSAAYVTYDALPGQVFDFTVASRDFGVASAQQTASGQLTAVEVSNRWVRDAQRIRVNLTSEQAIPPQLFVGSRATVVLYPVDNVWWQTLASIQIKLAGLLHYIY